MYIMGSCSTFSKTFRDFPGGPVVETLLPVLGVWVQPLVWMVAKIPHAASCGPKIKKQNKATKIRYQGARCVGPEQPQS